MSRTSTAVKKRYNDKTYRRITIAAKLDEYEQIRKYSEATGKSVSGFLRRMIRENAIIKE